MPSGRAIGLALSICPRPPSSFVVPANRRGCSGQAVAFGRGARGRLRADLGLDLDLDLGLGLDLGLRPTATWRGVAWQGWGNVEGGEGRASRAEAGRGGTWPRRGADAIDGTRPQCPSVPASQSPSALLLAAADAPAPPLHIRGRPRVPRQGPAHAGEHACVRVYVRVYVQAGDFGRIVEAARSAARTYVHTCLRGLRACLQACGGAASLLSVSVSVFGFGFGCGLGRGGAAFARPVVREEGRRGRPAARAMS